MATSFPQLSALLRLAFVALSVLLLLGLNGRTVNTLRLPAPAGQTRVSATPRPLVVKEKVTLEATAPLGPYEMPAAALGWLPAVLPSFGSPSPRRLRRALLRVPQVRAGVAAAARFRQRVLRVALSPQAP